MDCGAPKYRAFLVEQARRHLEKLPDSDGICIDRLDWLRAHNLRADDGQSWRRSGPSRALYVSWRHLLAEIGPMFHAADKVIFVNAMINRTDLLRHVDGIYHEFGHQAPDLNGAALQCVLKPCIAWTPDENTLKPDPDAFFQRQLYLGVFPTAPLPANDHTISAGTWADRWYLDYGPLFDTLRGRQWVLAPHAVSVEADAAKANLFSIARGHVLAVAFGPQRGPVRVRLGHLRGFEKAQAEALHPGSSTPVPVPTRFRKGALELTVPLARGCAMVFIRPPTPPPGVAGK